MLMNHLFGKNYQNITQNESIKKTKQTFIFHLASTERANTIFSVAGLSVVQSFFNTTNNNNDINDRIQRSFCGKVSVMNNATMATIPGYILSETIDQCRVQLANNNIIYIPFPTYSMDTWTFSPPNFVIDEQLHHISQYDPICIKISKRGTIMYVTNRHVCRIGPGTGDLPVIIPNQCS